MLADLAADAHTRGVAVELHAGAAPLLRADEALLRVLLRNLLDNAIRYAPRGSGVEVRVESAASGPVLTVTDSGPGIPPGERDRVLGRFYRALGTSEPGAGLGLSIVARIATLHGATLVLGEGPGGRGLAVRVAFPRERPPD